MDAGPTLMVFEDDASRPAALAVLAQHLVQYHRNSDGGDFRQLFALLWDGPDRLVGGLIGATHGEWLYVEFIWVDERLRGRGYGSRLLTAAEQEAEARGCQRAYLDNSVSAAAGFFRQRGYAVCGELPDFTPGQSRYWFHKTW